MATQCSLHICNSNEYCHHPPVDGSSSYNNSVSTDTLWDPKSEPALPKRQSYKQPRPNTVYHQPTSTTHSYTNRYIHSNQIQPVQSAIATSHAYYQPQYAIKPKSWDNLAAKGCGGYAIGYVVSNTGPKHQGPPVIRNDPQRAPPLPRKAGHAPYGRYSAFADVENYVPAPQAYVQEATITKTTIITTKSTENLISNAQYNGSCECVVQPSAKLTKQIVASNCMACNQAANNANAYQGYYSTLRNNSNHCIIPTKTEITRL